MTHVLFVDDDAVTLKLYETALTRAGFRVTALSDGIRASQALITSRPDIVVLDLMMPNFNGVDVLKFIRSTAALEKLPVIVLTNAYLTDLAEKAMAIGVQEAILKVRCSPSHLAGTINRLLAEGDAPPATPAAIPAEAEPTPLSEPTSDSASDSTPESAPAPRPAPAARPVQVPAQAADEGETHRAAVRASLLANAAKTRTDLHLLYQEFLRAQTDMERNLRLQNLYRRVHFLSATAGMAGCPRITLLASAFEALLFELMNQPALITASTRLTVAMTNDFLGELLGRAREVEDPASSTPRALVVDDDPLSNRLISSALRYDQLLVTTTEDPYNALQLANEAHYDLFLLDIEMPGLDGFQLCQALRTMPEYQSAPVIFVTSHADFDSRAKSVMSGSNDLISKPVFPIELAVKAITHLLRSSLDTPPHG